MIDFGAIFSQLFINLWWLPPLLLIFVLLKSAWFKGVMGEAMVNLFARLILTPAVGASGISACRILTNIAIVD